DLDSGWVIEDEQMTGTEASRTLHRPLPRGVTNVETTLYYRPRPGHPDPGLPLDADDEPHQGGDDQRLFDRGLKRVHDGGGGSSARPKSKIGGVWMADCVTPWGDKASFPVIANARDMQLFGKLGVNDVLYTYSELHSGWICLTRKSGKELQERTLNKEERKLFDAAKLTEIQNLEGSNAISFITDPDEIEKIRATMSHRLMPSRFILTKKQQEIGMAWKAKARWILLGHRDPDAQALERYAPTPATPTVYLAFQILSSLHYRLVIMDVSSAFGQSDAHEREQGGNKRHEALMERLRQRFKFGKWREIFGGSGEYLGRTVSQKDDFEITVSMERYVREKLPREMVKDETRQLNENETTLVRGAGGSLLWVGREARPDVAASCAMTMTWGKEGPTVQNIKFCNKVIQELHNTSGAYLRILPIGLEDGIWLVFSDASLGNDGDKSQGGFMVAFCDRCIIDGKIARLSINSRKSHRLRRAVKASLGSEALALDDGLAELEWVKALFCEAVVPGTCVSDGTRYGEDETIAVARMIDDGDPTVGVTDARALYDLYHRRSGAAWLCRRAQLDVAVMSKSAEVLRTKVFWIPGANMPADCLTKRLGNSSLMRWLMANARYALTQDSLSMLWETPLDGCETKQHVPQSMFPEVSC
ncbi:GIP, partial [Symbiodinium necroappetens]